MSEEVDIRGLCSTCDNYPGCTLPASRDKAAWHCEEFRSSGAPPVRTPGEQGLPPPRASATADGESTRFTGLCSDCEGRSSCVFPKPEGGVWHCEEYR
jgi:hypothetical protein